MPQDLFIPPPPATRRRAARWRRMDDRPQGTRHQPWLPEAEALPVPDDFSRHSVTDSVRGVALALALAALVLAMGRSAQLLDAAYGLDTFWGSDTLIAVAEAWHGAMEWLGIPAGLDALRDALGVAAD